MIESCLKQVYLMLDERRRRNVWESICKLLHTTLTASKKVTALNFEVFSKITRVLLKDEIADVSILI
jgi:hypothetical protein